MNLTLSIIGVLAQGKIIWELGKLLRSLKKCHGWRTLMSWCAPWFLSESQQQGDKFSRSCSRAFYRVKTEIYQLNLFIFVFIRERVRETKTEYKYAEKDIERHVILSSLTIIFTVWTCQNTNLTLSGFHLPLGDLNTKIRSLGWSKLLSHGTFSLNEDNFQTQFLEII